MQLYSSSQSQIKHIVSTFRPHKDWAKKSPKALRHFKRKGPNLGSICEAYGFRALEVANEQYYEFRSACHRFAIPKDVQVRVNCMIKRKASIDEVEAVDVNGIPFGELVVPTRLLVARNRIRFINEHFAGLVSNIDTTTSHYLQMIDTIGVEDFGEHWGRHGILPPRIGCVRYLVDCLERTTPIVPDSLPDIGDRRTTWELAVEYFEDHPDEPEDCH